MRRFLKGLTWVVTAPFRGIVKNGGGGRGGENTNTKCNNNKSKTKTKTKVSQKDTRGGCHGSDSSSSTQKGTEAETETDTAHLLLQSLQSSSSDSPLQREHFSRKGSFRSNRNGSSSRSNSSKSIRNSNSNSNSNNSMDPNLDNIGSVNDETSIIHEDDYSQDEEEEPHPCDPLTSSMDGSGNNIMKHPKHSNTEIFSIGSPDTTCGSSITGADDVQVYAFLSSSSDEDTYDNRDVHKMNNNNKTILRCSVPQLVRRAAEEEKIIVAAAASGSVSSRKVDGKILVGTGHYDWDNAKTEADQRIQDNSSNYQNGDVDVDDVDGGDGSGAGSDCANSTSSSGIEGSNVQAENGLPQHIVTKPPIAWMEKYTTTTTNSNSDTGGSPRSDDRLVPASSSSSLEEEKEEEVDIQSAVVDQRSSTRFGDNVDLYDSSAVQVGKRSLDESHLKVFSQPTVVTEDPMIKPTAIDGMGTRTGYPDPSSPFGNASHNSTIQSRGKGGNLPAEQDQKNISVPNGPRQLKCESEGSGVSAKLTPSPLSALLKSSSETLRNKSRSNTGRHTSTRAEGHARRTMSQRQRQRHRKNVNGLLSGRSSYVRADDIDDAHDNQNDDDDDDDVDQDESYDSFSDVSSLTSMGTMTCSSFMLDYHPKVYLPLMMMGATKGTLEEGNSVFTPTTSTSNFSRKSSLSQQKRAKMIRTLRTAVRFSVHVRRNYKRGSNNKMYLPVQEEVLDETSTATDQDSRNIEVHSYASKQSVKDNSTTMEAVPCPLSSDPSHQPRPRPTTTTTKTQNHHVILMLMDPRQYLFEFVSIDCSVTPQNTLTILPASVYNTPNTTISVAEVLARLPTKTISDFRLRFQKYVGFTHFEGIGLFDSDIIDVSKLSFDEWAKTPPSTKNAKTTFVPIQCISIASPKASAVPFYGDDVTHNSSSALELKRNGKEGNETETEEMPTLQAPLLVAIPVHYTAPQMDIFAKTLLENPEVRQSLQDIRDTLL